MSLDEPVIQLLADLVSIPSMNPMGRAREGPAYAEGRLASYVADYLHARGIRTETTEVAPGRPNVLGFVDAGADRTILLEAHLDTVHADNMDIPPFTPAVKDGRLYGRGSCDTKASLAAFLRAVCGIVESGRSPKYNIVIAAVVDEEYRFTGAKLAVAKGLHADFGIAGEPTQLRIIRAHKGVTRWKIVTEGKAAHSAYPGRGINAIYAMGHVLNRLEAYASALVRLSPHPELGTPTMSVGVIEGGQAVNIVPDRCWIEIDRRTLPDEDASGLLAPVREALRGVEGWTFEEPHLSVTGMDVPSGAPVVRMLEAAIRKITGDCLTETAHYATDAGVYNRAGIPTIVFGPGDIARAHTANEFVDIDQVTLAEKIIRSILL
jgi:acetylornithine deacetylase/succinyl-diaminopimelate desuccinylase family protein